MLPIRCFFGKSVDITHTCWTEIIQRGFNPNRSLGLAWILSFRRVDFVWLLTKKWARCLPNWGTMLAQHGHGACPGWAELTTDSCPISSCCNIRIPAFRLLPMHGTKKYRPRKRPERYSFFEPYTPAARIHLPLAARIRSPDMLTCNQTIQTIENNHLVANCLYIKALQQKTRRSDDFDVFFEIIDTSSYFTTLMTRGATLLPSMRTRKTGALTSEREVRADVICRDERRRPAVLYTLRTAPTAF